MEHKSQTNQTALTRQDLLSVLLASPDVVVYLLIFAIGAVAAAWILIGAGVAVALLVAIVTGYLALMAD